MAESWRHILERAAENLSIDLKDPDARRAELKGSSWSGTHTPAERLRSFAETRDSLARELGALSSPPRRAGRSHLLHPARHAKRPSGKDLPSSSSVALAPVARRAVSGMNSGWRNVAAVLLSSAVLYLAAHVFRYSPESNEVFEEWRRAGQTVHVTGLEGDTAIQRH
jgi:hypothetical protein